MSQSPSITGASPVKNRSFAPTFTTSASAQTSIAAGGYYLISTADCWVQLAKSGATAPTLPGTSQPAEGSPNALTPCVAGVPTPLDVDGSVPQFISIIGVSTSGTLYIAGPLTNARVPR